MENNRWAPLLQAYSGSLLAFLGFLRQQVPTPHLSDPLTDPDNPDGDNG